MRRNKENLQEHHMNKNAYSGWQQTKNALCSVEMMRNALNMQNEVECGNLQVLVG